MGSPNANVKHREMQSELQAAGWTRIGQNGSHERWAAPDGTETVSLFMHGGGDAGPKNVHTIRKAIERVARRRDEIEAAKSRSEALVELVQDAQGHLSRGTEAGRNRELERTMMVGQTDRTQEALLVRLSEGLPVEVIEVEATGRTKKLLGTVDVARRNLFTLVQDNEWRRGTWPDVLRREDRRKRVKAIVVRVWRELSEGEGHPEEDPGWVDVYWLNFEDMHHSLTAIDGERLRARRETGVPLELVYSGPFVKRPQDHVFNETATGDGGTIDTRFRLTFNRDTGGTWAPNLQYRFDWRVNGPTGDVVWAGWATEAEAVEAGLEEVLSLLEGFEAQEVERLEREAVEALEAATLVPEEEVPVTTARPPSTTDHPAVVPIPADLVPRLEALVSLLDTPAVRAVTGRAVTVEEVARITLLRGVEALERDLKGG